MPFEVVSGVGRGMGVLDGDEDRRRGRGRFRGKCGTSHRNQCDSLRERRRRGTSEITLGFLVQFDFEKKNLFGSTLHFCLIRMHNKMQINSRVQMR